jgi:hypothetical protein
MKPWVALKHSKAHSRNHGLELSCSLRHGATNGPSVPWLESARSCIRQAQQSSICEQVGSEIDSETFGQPCALGFPITGSQSQTSEVGFVGSRLQETERSTVLRTSWQRQSSQQKDDKSKPGSKGSKAITGVTYRT